MMMDKSKKRLFILLLLFLVTLSSCNFNPASEDLTLERLYEKIDQLAVYYQDLIAVDTIGYGSDEAGREDPALPIKRITITSADITNPDPAKILVTGAFHGDESISSWVVLNLAEHLALFYSHSRAVTNLLNDYEIHLIPAVNPWGYRNESRFTASGVDLNRDFGQPDPELDSFEGFHPWTGGFEAPESSILKELCEQELYLFSIMGHTGGENINSPMDYIAYVKLSVDYPHWEISSSEFLADYLPIYSLMAPFAESYADSLQRRGYPNFYAAEGGDWYTIKGSFTDWHFGTLGAPGYTIEFDKRQYRIKAEEQAGVSDAHIEPLVDLLTLADHRIYGTAPDPDAVKVTAEESTDSRKPGDPLKLALTAPVDKEGCFHLLIPPGSWRISFSDSSDTVLAEDDIVLSESGFPYRL